MNYKTLFLLFCLLAGCATKKGTEKNQTKMTSNEQTSEDNQSIKAVIGHQVKDSDPIMGIDSIYMDGNYLIVALRYGGGCKEHTFGVVGSEMIAKSYPPIRAIQIVHRANEDHCRAIKDTTLQVDMTDLAYKQEVGSEIYYTLKEWKGKILHTFVATK